MNIVSTYLKNKLVIGTIAIVVLISIGFVFAGNGALETISVSKKDIVQEVVLTGKTVASDTVNINAEQSGKVVKILADIGSVVKQDQVLAVLDSSELQAKISQARADVLSAQAGLSQYEASRDVAQVALEDLKNGTRVEDIEIKKANLNKAQADLMNTLNSSPDTVSDSAIKADGVLRNNLDGIFLNNNDQTSVRLGFDVPNTQIKNDVEYMRVVAQQSLIKLQKNATDISKIKFDSSESFSPTMIILESSRSELYFFRDFLNKVMDALVGSSGVSSTQLADYKTKVENARTSISNSITTLNSKLDSIRSLKANVDVSSSDLKKSQSGASSEEIRSQELKIKEAEALILSQRAKIQSAQAVLQSYNVQLRKYSLVAPFPGVITRKNIVNGQNIQTSDIAFSLISNNLLLVEANVPEIEIGRIRLSDKVEIAIDAFGQEKFSGTVKLIEPAETIIDGVINYKIKIAFDSTDSRIISGLTTNIRIETLRRDSVVSVPEFVLEKRSGEYFVKKLVDENVEDVKVEIGARGVDGDVEIISGLSEGDLVVRPVQE